MEDRQYDGHSYEFAYCWAVLGYNKTILMNWAINPNSIREIEHGTSFHVGCAGHTGHVEVTVDYDSDTFAVVLKTDAGGTLSSHRGICLSQLIRVITRLVEKADTCEKPTRHTSLVP